MSLSLQKKVIENSDFRIDIKHTKQYHIPPHINNESKRTQFNTIHVNAMKQDSKSTHKHPIIGGKKLSFFDLFLHVEVRGGLEAVYHNKRFKEIGQAMGIPEAVTAVGYLLRKKYERFISPYIHILRPNIWPDSPATRVFSPSPPPKKIEPHAITTKIDDPKIDDPKIDDPKISVPPQMDTSSDFQVFSHPTGLHCAHSSSAFQSYLMEANDPSIPNSNSINVADRTVLFSSEPFKQRSMEGCVESTGLGGSSFDMIHPSSCVVNNTTSVDSGCDSLHQRGHPFMFKKRSYPTTVPIASSSSLPSSSLPSSSVCSSSPSYIGTQCLSTPSSLCKNGNCNQYPHAHPSHPS
ncbi:hypothetical protein ADUPG1_011981, partial [Aduncisulcus paluster]